MLAEWIETFAQEMELDLALLQQAGSQPEGIEGTTTYQIPLAEGLTLYLEQKLGQREISLFCALAKFAPKEEGELLLNLLLANLFGQGTYGAILGLSIDGEQVLLRQQSSTLEYSTFIAMLENFINAVDFWQGELLAG